MNGNFIMLQEDQLREYLAEIFEESICKLRLLQKPSLDEDEYITREEVCTRIHITYTTLWRMEKRGEIQVHKIGRRNLYAKKDVDLIVAEGLSNNSIHEKYGK